MKLNELQRFKMQEAHQKTSDVLREIKHKKLKGKELEDMKLLEQAVVILEHLALTR